MDGDVVTVTLQVSDNETMDLPVLSVDGYGDFDLDIVGESNYQDALWDAFGEPPEGDEPKQVQTRAVLVFDSENQYDPNAVEVHIDGRIVGYLARDDAKAYRTALHNLSVQRQQPIVISMCDAVIVGGFMRRSGERASLGVKLDLEIPIDDFTEEE